MRRRDFIAGLGGSAVSWPLVARAQQRAGTVRRVGVLRFDTEDDRPGRRAVGVLRESLEKLGWSEGRNLRLDIRFVADDPGLRAAAAELVNLDPDVTVGLGRAATRALQRQTQTVPIVFTNVGDPADNDVVRNIARPEGNITGFTNYFSSAAGKWVELMKIAIPRIATIGLIFNREVDPAGNYLTNESFLEEIEKAARTLAVNTRRIPVRDAEDIVRAINAFATEPNGALIAVAPPLVFSNRQLVDRLAIEHRLPWMQSPGEGLFRYGPDTDDIVRGAASYVDRILRGAKPGDLPVQFPTRFKLTVNLKSAKAIGLTIPEELLLRADEVIE